MNPHIQVYQLTMITVKSFHTLQEAQDYIAGKLIPKPAAAIPGEQRFYGVQRGVKPGVYTDWPAAQAQIKGYTAPRYKKFNSRAEAEAFVAEGSHQYPASNNLSSEEELRRLIVNRSAPGLQSNGPYQPRDKNGDAYEIGTGPLPPGAEDGFDPNIKLGPSATGELVYKTDEEKARTKLVPREKQPPGMLRIYTDGSSLRNGTAGARAGVGVYFGPQDPKYDSRPSSSSNSRWTHSPAPPPPQLPAPETIYSIDWPERAAIQRRQRRQQRPGHHASSDADDDSTASENEQESKGPKLTNWRYRNVSEALKGSKQTNQRAELTAIQRALEVAPTHRDVTIYTDSKYSIDCVTNWHKGWERNGWRNSKGKPVENMDLVKAVRSLIEEREFARVKTLFVWVKGHSGQAGNEAADRLAVAGSLMSREGSASEVDGPSGGELSAMDEDGDRDVKLEDGRNGKANGSSLPNGVGEDEDVKRAFEDMAASMDEDDKNGGGYP